eukprot:TRINITY_DN125643_c0_g1_i1.p1 TRINITY_DN125643_c0_g1~~TRINITY_DN125643_c0_g1_i1.p1  ORF type:complete len:664 (+),score=172.46 TRINITY_DN125643_c0_g1_i1:78-2069(+)
MEALEGRWLERIGDVELTFEIVHLESQGMHLFSRARNGHTAVTGRLQEQGDRWTATLSDGGALTLRWKDARNGEAAQEKVLLRKERRGGQPVENGEARPLVVSEEWQAIVHQALRPGELMKVEAAPGSGKTTALREWCRNQTDSQILFLSYSKSVQQQQELNFGELANVTVRTIHSLAKEATGTTMNPVEMTKTAVKEACGVSWDEAGIIHTEYLNFLHSADRPSNFSRMVQKLWRRVSDGRMSISHDGYLKKFQLELASSDASASLQGVLQPFGAIVLDEAQDCTEAMLDIFKRIPEVSKVAAFDVHQNISQFRGVSPASTRALNGMPAAVSTSLPQSFRFGPKIAKLLTSFIKLHKGEGHVKVRGDPSKKTSHEVVALSDAVYRRALAKSGRLTVLARKNSTLFAEVKKLINCPPGRQPLKLYFLGGWKTYSETVLGPVLDVYYLANGETAMIQSRFVKRYNSLDKFRFVVDKQDMVDWKVKLDMYDAHEHDLVELVKQVKRSLVAQESEADIVFATVHKAKGLGWPSVLLLDDFLSSHNGKVPEEEVNICYVALSRVSTDTLYTTFNPLVKHSFARPCFFDVGFDDYFNDDVSSDYDDEPDADEQADSTSADGEDEDAGESDSDGEDEHGDDDGVNDDEGDAGVQDDEVVMPPRRRRRIY